MMTDNHHQADQPATFRNGAGEEAPMAAIAGATVRPIEPPAMTCGNGCACATQCGDTYAAIGLPRPPKIRPTLTIRALSDAADAGPELCGVLHDSEARNLVDYVHDLEHRHRALEARMREGTAGLRPQVLAFAWLMEHKLRHHDDDRGREGWQHDGTNIGDMIPRTYAAWLDLRDASNQWPRGPEQAQQIASKAADVANFAMMAADLAGTLEGIGPGPVPKMRQRLRQVHRLHAHLERLIVRALERTDPPTPQHRVLALQADAKALRWVLQALDPQAIHAPRPTPPDSARIQGDGSGQTLPPAQPFAQWAAGQRPQVAA